MPTSSCGCSSLIARKAASLARSILLTPPALPVPDSFMLPDLSRTKTMLTGGLTTPWRISMRSGSVSSSGVLA